MKKNTKKTLSFIAAVVMTMTMLGTMALANNTVVVTGDIDATSVQFTVPTDTSFAIDPNAAVGSNFSAPMFNIANDSNAPLKLEVGAFHLNGASPYTSFVDVAPGAYGRIDPDWAILDKTKSESELALALEVGDASQYRTQAQSSSLYVVDLDIGTVEIGVIEPLDSVDMTLSAKHGLAFSSPIQVKYDLVFIFSLQ